MDLYICIDDTDNLDSKGTGSIADELTDIIKNEYKGKCTFVSRHQLLIHKDIEYTSHNSSMCFACTINDDQYEDVKNACLEHVKQESAEGSDPGVAIANFATMDTKTLIAYGKDCKRKVMSKDLAYSTAKDTNVFLTELGGTGAGVIGALAGIGLRAWGNDGTLKKKLKEFTEGELYTVAQLKTSKFIKYIINEKGEALKDDEMVLIPPKTKPALVNGELTLLTAKTEGKDTYEVLKKDDIKNYGANMIFKEGCTEFTPDVEEEQIDNVESCFNCRYRRWMEGGLVMCSIGRDSD